VAFKESMIPSSTIDEIRNKADILTIIGEYVALKKRGKNYLGLCPFHSEKTPSFTVSPDKQIFHCFGCGEGGNIFSFIMKLENVSFAESVAMMGERVGIQVKDTGIKTGAPQDKERFFMIMELSQKYYHDTLDSEQGQGAKEYINKRGLSDEAVAAFALGYATSSWSGLFDHLFKKGVSKEDMLKLGLIIERNDKSGYYDRFRSRLMFPIFNIRGKVIGFSGRILTAATPDDAKYINSPDSPIYNKGYSLFGIYQTKDEIRHLKTAVIVEGNADLLSCWQSGVKNVVAPLGTALTSSQAKLISRFATKAVLAFDADNAGINAAAKGVDTLKDEGLSVYVANYEGGKDPDEAIKAKGAESFKKSIDEPTAWMEFMVMHAISKHDLKEIEARAKAAKEAAFIIGQEKDELIRKGYIRLVADKLGFASEEIASEVKRQQAVMASTPNDKKSVMEKPISKLEKAESTLIKIAIDDGETLKMLKENLSWQDFSSDNNKIIAEKLMSANVDDGVISHFLLENINDEEIKKYLSSIVVSELPAGDVKKTAHDCMNTIKAHHLKQKMEEIRGRIIAAEREGRTENVPGLHKEFQEMNEAYRSLSV
jgi:DNA primase